MDHIRLFLCLTLSLIGNFLQLQPVLSTTNSFPLSTSSGKIEQRIGIGNTLSSSAAGSLGASSSATTGCTWLQQVQGSSAPSNQKLLLDCQLRKLNVDIWNYTFTRLQLETTASLRIQCNEQLFFESFLNPNQNLFQLTNLESLQIHSCKIRKVPARLWMGLSLLRNLTVRSYNGEWSSSFGLEVEKDGFEGLSGLENLDLSFNNMWSLEDNVFCPLRNLLKLNLSHNRLSEDVFGDEIGSSKSTTSGGDNNYCSRSLQNLDLSYNTIRKIRRNGFSRFRRLNELRLQNNYIEELEDSAFFGLNQLKLINISTNRLVALPPSLFDPTPNLRELYLQNNSITALSPQVFARLEQLVLLDLSKNSLTSLWIKDEMFSGLIRLIVLKLSFNQLSYIDPTIFHDLISLQALHLDNNRIETVNPGAFSSLTNLHLLDLSRNRLTFIDSRVFSSLFVLRQLFLDHNKIRRMDDDAFRNLTSLKDFGLSGNLLSEVPVALRFGLSSVEALDVGENRIDSVSNESFSGFGQLLGLRLVDNKISELPSGFCGPLKKLRVLNLAQNRLNQLNSNAFNGCPELRALRLDTNKLEELPTTLSPQLPLLLWLNVSENRLRWADYRLLPPTIEWLDLSYNSLVTLGGISSSLKVPVNPNHGNTFHLRVLDASYNNLTHLDYSAFPPTLETLRVNYNQLKSVAPDTFGRASRLRRVELIGNQLENLPMSALRIPTVGIDRPLPELFLAKNEFLCDCSMEWLSRVNQLSVLRQHPKLIDIDSVMCKSNYSRNNELIPVPDMKANQFLCTYTSHCFTLCHCCDFDACDCAMTCPEGCTCYHDSSWSSNLVECSNQNFSSLPEKIPMEATELYLDGNEIQSLGSHIFIGKKNLRVLYLNASKVESIKNKTFNGLRSLEILHLESNLLSQLYGFEFRDTENLRELYLENNALRSIGPESFSHLKFLQVLRLDGNYLSSFNLWELSGNSYLNNLMLASNPWSCECEFIVPFRTWINSRAGIVGDLSLVKCQAGSNFPTNNDKHLELVHPTTSLNTICTSSFSEEEQPKNHNSIFKNQGDENNNNHNHILDDSSSSSSASSDYGDGVGKEAVIHHPQRVEKDSSSTINLFGRRRKNENLEFGSSSSSFWTLILTLCGFLLLIVVILLIFRKEIHHWALRRLIITDNLSFCCQRNSSSSSSHPHEKVGNSSASGGAGDESDKLFDAYFIYNRSDEELITQKLCPGLESTPNSFRLLLHYRDLCLNHNNNFWNSEVVHSACDTSKRVVILLSKTFFQVELNQPESRSVLNTLIQKNSKKLIFILLPQPPNEPSLHSIYPELCNSSNLDWMDPNFWPKLRILLPTPTSNSGNGVDLSNCNTHHPELNYNFSQGSNYYHTRSPYQIPPSNSYSTGSFYNHQNNLDPYLSRAATLNRNNSLPVPKHHILITSPKRGNQNHEECLHNSHNLPHVIYPTTTQNFAENFRHHQSQQPYTFATMTHQHPHHHQKQGSGNSTSSGVSSKTLSNPYRPLLRTSNTNAPNNDKTTPFLTSPNSEDSGHVNCSSSSDELENEHVYSTLDTPLQSPNSHSHHLHHPHHQINLINDHQVLRTQSSQIGESNNKNRTMYFV